MISIISSSKYLSDKKKIINTCEKFLQKMKLTEPYCINIVFVGKRKMMFLSKNYKNEKRPLPILTFSYINSDDYNNQDNLLGELILCYPQVVLLAAEKNKTVDDMIDYLIIHGLTKLFS